MPLYPLLALKEHSWWRGHRLLLGMMFLVATIKSRSLTDIISCRSDLHSWAFLPWVHQLFSGIYVFSELSHIFYSQAFSKPPTSPVLEVRTSVFWEFYCVSTALLNVRCWGSWPLYFGWGSFGENVSLPVFFFLKFSPECLRKIF